jgi:hypothetical protein
MLGSAIHSTTIVCSFGTNELSRQTYGGKSLLNQPPDGQKNWSYQPLSGQICQAALAVALRQAAESCWSEGRQSLTMVRARVHQAVSALAFRQVLFQNEIPFSIFSFEPLAACPTLEVALGGRPCRLLEWTASGKPGKARAARLDEVLLDSALPDETIIVFYFLNGTVSKKEENSRPQTGSFALILPVMWSHPHRPVGLENLRLRLEGAAPFDLTLWGLDDGLDFRCRRISLHANTGTPVGRAWLSIVAMTTPSRPSATIRLVGHRPGETMNVDPHKWQNILPDVEGITLQGFAVLDDLRRLNHRAPVNGSLLAPKASPGVNKPLLLPDVRPLNTLLERVKIWETADKVKRIYTPFYL